MLLPKQRTQPYRHYTYTLRTTMPQNKYNQSRRLGSADKGILYYFCIKQFRFNTERHPINQSRERCAASLKAVVSHQETQILEGLSNTLECNERQALRICIYEFLSAGHPILDRDLERSKSGASEKGHESRNEKLVLKLPSSEKKAFQAVAKEVGLTDGELLRLSFIWLRNQIRIEDLAKLDNSSRRCQKELFRKWSSTHDGSPSKLTNLRDASQEAWDEAEERAFDRYLEKEQHKKLRRLYKAENKYADNSQIDALIQLDMQRLDPFESEIQQLLNEGKIDDIEAEIRRLMHHLCLSRTDAEVALDSEDDSKPTDDEIELMLSLLFEELYQDRISDWLDQHFDGDWQSLDPVTLKKERDKAEIEMKAVKREPIQVRFRGRVLTDIPELKIPKNQKPFHGIGTYFHASYQKPDEH